MEIILSILFLVGIWTYFKVQETKAFNHSSNYEVDWGKVNDDRIRNDISNHQMYKHVTSGKYDTGKRFNNK